MLEDIGRSGHSMAVACNRVRCEFVPRVPVKSGTCFVPAPSLVHPARTLRCTFASSRREVLCSANDRHENGLSEKLCRDYLELRVVSAVSAVLAPCCLRCSLGISLIRVGVWGAGGGGGWALSTLQKTSLTNRLSIWQVGHGSALKRSEVQGAT